MLSYYKENLSYYKEIISDNEDSKPVQMEEKIEAPILAKVEKRESIDTNMIQTVFDKKASSYKYFWLMAILSLAKEKEILSLSFQDITIRMAAMAWPIVYEDEIDLGSRDMMKNYLDEVVKKTTLIKAASSNVVDKYLSQHYTSQGVNKILSPLMKNVPYLLTLFMFLEGLLYATSTFFALIIKLMREGSDYDGKWIVIEQYFAKRL